MSSVSPTMSSEVEAKINLFDALENSPKVSTVICEMWDDQNRLFTRHRRRSTNWKEELHLLTIMCSV